MRKIDYTVEEYFEGKKLYSFLKGHAKLSSKLIRSLKRSPDGLKINGEWARTVDLLHSGDTVSITIPDDEKGAVPGTTLPEVVFEDSDLLIVNKSPMLPIHESHNHQGDTLANCVALHLQNEGKSSTFRAIGRLDKGTSGLVVCALNSHTASRLSGKIEKTYIAIATGKFEGSGTIDAPIYRPDAMKTYRTVDERGDRAVTHWEAIKTNGSLTALRIKLETGRTHQIRVHFASLGAPLIGDTMYGEPDENISHQALHCAELTFTHPITGETVHCSADMPEDMQKIFDSISE